MQSSHLHNAKQALNDHFCVFLNCSIIVKEIIDSMLLDVLHWNFSYVRWPCIQRSMKCVPRPFASHTLKCSGSVVGVCGRGSHTLVRALALPTWSTSPPSKVKALIVKRQHLSLLHCSWIWHHCSDPPFLFLNLEFAPLICIPFFVSQTDEFTLLPVAVYNFFPTTCTVRFFS